MVFLYEISMLWYMVSRLYTNLVSPTLSHSELCLLLLGFV